MRAHHSELSRSQLYELARKAGIEGRSRMGKEQLMLALEEQPVRSRPIKRGHSPDRSRPAEKAPAMARRPTSGRPLWKGSISFGLVSIPVGLYTATEDRDLSFHMLSAADGSRIRFQRVSSATGREVPLEGIVKGYEYEKDHYVTFTDDELQRMPSDSLHAIDVVQFVAADEIDPVYFDRSYYVGPDKAAVKAYRVLAQALQESGRVAVGKVTLRDKERLCALRVADGVLVMETMKWPDEIRVPAFDSLGQAAQASPREVTMAVQLIDQLTEPFDPSQFQDSYRARLEEAIQAKIEGRQVRLAPEPRAPATVTDLLSVLRASVEATRLKKSA